MAITEEKELEIYRTAANMAQSGSSTSDIKHTILTMGADEQEADTIIQQVTPHRVAEERDSGVSHILTGVLFLAGGIIATAATDGNVLFYGAMIVGGIRIITGIIRMGS